MKENQIRRQLISDFNQFATRMRLQYIYHDQNTEQHPFYVKSLRQAGCIDEVTAKWFNQTPDPPRIPVFYTLTKIHKPTLVGRPIISGCDGLTERLSSFPSGVDKVLQPIAQIQESYLKDTTHFIRFIESTRVPKNAFLVSMDVTSMYTNIPQEEGITIVCNAYENFYSVNKPLPWKRFIYEVFCLWDTNKEEIEHFIEQANSYNPTIKFTAEVSQLETTFLDTTVYKGERFEKEPILDVRTHYKPTETLQYTNYDSCHPAGVKKGFVKEEALRLLRTNSSKVMFEENIKNFRTRLTSRGYPNNLVEKILSEVKFAERKNALTQKKILPFVTQFHPSLPCLKNILTEKWHLIQNQPLLREIYKEPPLISYRKGRSLKDMLVLSKTIKAFINTMGTQL